MDILPSSPQPVAFTNRQNAVGAASFVQLPASAADASRATAANAPPTSNQIAQAVRKVNDSFTQKGINLYASFEKDQISGVSVVKILEKKSNEVIRQLPPIEVVAFAQSLELPEGWRGQWIRNMT